MKKKKKGIVSGYRQLRHSLTIKFAKNPLEKLGHIDQWMETVLQIEIEPIKSKDQGQNLKNHTGIAALAWRVQLLSRSLLQSIRIPVFDPGEILHIDKSPDDSYTVILSLPYVESISPAIFEKSVDTAYKLILQFGKIPITDKSRQNLFYLIETEFIKPAVNLSGSGKSTMPILEEAYSMDIPFRHLGNGIYQLGYGSKARRINKSTVDSDSLIGAQMAQNKVSTASIIRSAAMPAPIHAVVNSEKHALNAAKAIGWPVVVKPADMDRGEGVTVDVNDNTELIKAFTHAQKISRTKRVIIEKQVNGVCCRVFVAFGTMFYAVNRHPKSITGNGVDTVEKLIDTANEKEANLPPWKRTEPYPKDTMALEAIKAVDLSPTSIPKKGELVPLRQIESTQWGGYDENVTTTIHPENVTLALKAAKLFGLDVSGVDIITPDITIPWYSNGAIINEVNPSPQYGGGDISRRTISLFLEELMDERGHIPITVITGHAKSLERSRALQKNRSLKE